MRELCGISLNKMFLIKQMMKLKYQDGAPMLDHLSTFQGNLNQLSRMNIKLRMRYMSYRCLVHCRTHGKYLELPYRIQPQMVY